MKWRTYPGYKGSGVVWLDQIPEQWQILPIKRVAQFYTGWTPPTGRDEYFGGDHPWANISDLGPKILVATSKTISDLAIKESRLRLSPKGSLLFSFKLSIGQVSIAGVDMYTNEAIATFPPNNGTDLAHLYWAAPIFIPHNADQNIYGAELLNQELIENARIAVPPREEQSIISTFLDRETARIDALIEKKQRQIELLQEKRAALISHAVTQGLDPNVKMKDSGVEWLGQIPEHWSVKRLRLSFNNLDHRRIPLSAEERSYMEKNYPYYGASGIIDSVESYIFDEPLILVAEDGANLLSRSTPLAFIAEGKYWVNNHAHILKPISGSLKYWEGLLQSYDYTPLISGSAQPKLTAEDLGNVPLPIPPENEQWSISAYVIESCERIDKMINKVQESSERLREYRTAIISASVTGKIDVREEVA